MKVHNSTVKLYSKGVEVNKNTPKIFNINYAESKDNIVKIDFNEELVDKVKVYTNNKEIECINHKTDLECKINNDSLPYNQNKSNEYKKYEININDYCGNKVYSFEVNVKYTETPKNEDSDSDYKTLVIILACVGGILVILIIAFCILRRNRNSNKINIDDDMEETKIIGLTDKEE